MNKHLYLLRQPANRIPASIFLASETEGDVVLLEEAASSSLSVAKGTVSTIGREMGSRGSDLTYDDLVERIFENDYVMVI
jgi:hypothetical protein